MNKSNTYTDKLEKNFNIKKTRILPEFLPATYKEKSKVCKVEKVGKLHKANRAVKISSKRENLETEFMKVASLSRRKSERAKAQRDARRAKR